jgi:hypothetical protein
MQEPGELLTFCHTSMIRGSNFGSVSPSAF